MPRGGAAFAMSAWPMRALAGVAMLAALALLAAVIAWWGWRIAGPAPVHIPVAAPADPAATILASGLLAATGAAPAAPPAAKDEGTLATGNARLLGVVAERDGRGYALFRLPSGPKLVAPGQEIAQGAQLVDVQPGAITIRDGGGERRIVLRGDPPAPAKTGAAAAPVRAAAARSAACTPPAGFKGAVLRLNAELFQGIIAKPESWAALVTPVDGVLDRARRQRLRRHAGDEEGRSPGDGQRHRARDARRRRGGGAAAAGGESAGARHRIARRRAARMAAAQRRELSRVAARGSQRSRSSGASIQPSAGHRAGSSPVPM